MRSSNGDWYTLQCGTGRDLVEAVIRALARIGFRNVVDVDLQAASQPERGPLREDIQILDRDPGLIVDVKGVAGHPSDEDVHQAEKHLLMRTREWKGKDLQALMIMNAQRHLPPHERDLVAYRPEIIANAAQVGYGLMTTWDLVCILRNMEALNWSPEDVLPLFYGVGRISVIPRHYQPIGTILHKWSHSIGFVPTVSVQLGDRLAMKIGDNFREYEILSIRIDGEESSCAVPGSNCGAKLSPGHKGIREGMTVFSVGRSSLNSRGPHENTG